MKSLSMFLAALMFVAAPVIAKDKGEQGNSKKGQQQKHEKVENGDASDGSSDSNNIVGTILDATKAAVIKDYYSQNPQGAGSLPPGIQKRLAQGKPLPPGIAKRAPQGLASKLNLPKGTDLVTIGNDAVLVDIGTNIVREILNDVVN